MSERPLTAKAETMSRKSNVPPGSVKSSQNKINLVSDPYGAKENQSVGQNKS